MKSNNNHRVACLLCDVESITKFVLTDITDRALKKRLSIGYNAFLTISFI